MTFEEMFQQAKASLAKASVDKTTAHIAVQVNVTGEGSGIFYAKAADGVLAVEPYDYVDNDAILTADSQELLDALKNADTAKLTLEGNAEKIAAFRAILATLPAPKKTVSKTTKPTPAKKAETKETAAPKPASVTKAKTVSKSTEASKKADSPKAAAVKPAAATAAAKAPAEKTATARKCGRTKK